MSYAAETLKMLLTAENREWTVEAIQETRDQLLMEIAEQQEVILDELRTIKLALTTSGRASPSVGNAGDGSKEEP